MGMVQPYPTNIIIISFLGKKCDNASCVANVFRFPNYGFDYCPEPGGDRYWVPGNLDENFVHPSWNIPSNEIYSQILPPAFYEPTPAQNGNLQYDTNNLDGIYKCTSGTCSDKDKVSENI